MSQTFWEPEVGQEQQPQQQPGEQAKEFTGEPSQETASLALSVDDFSALEERIVRTVELVKRERQARADAEQRAQKAEAQLGDQLPVVDQLKQEIHGLRAERDHVRQRVERLLSQLDALEL